MREDEIDDRVKRMLARTAETYRKAGEQPLMHEGEIGRAALEILRTQESLTIADLLEFFRRKIDTSSSARGKVREDLDLQRRVWEGIVKRLSPPDAR